MGRAIVSPPPIKREGTSLKLRRGTLFPVSLLIAVIVSAAVVVGSPCMVPLQPVLRQSLSTPSYVLLFGVGVVAAVGQVILMALVGIREGRRQRFGLLVIALVFGGAY